MSRFDDTIKCLESDLEPLHVPREQYLASCVKTRLSENLDKYNTDFEKLLKSLEQDTIHEADLTKLLRTIQSFSRLIDHLYSNLLRSIEQQESLLKD